jgi:hypothetical protein
MNKEFAAVIDLIKHVRAEAIRFVNTELVNLYWNAGAYISIQIANARWGDKTVRELAKFIQKNHPELKGFNRSGLYRMVQFYNTYHDTSFINLNNLPKHSLSAITFRVDRRLIKHFPQPPPEFS